MDSKKLKIKYKLNAEKENEKDLTEKGIKHCRISGEYKSHLIIKNVIQIIGYQIINWYIISKERFGGNAHGKKDNR